MGNGVRRFTDLRAWQACLTYKRAVYATILDSTLAKDWDRRSQLEQSVKGPTGHIAEGFGRFNPADFARFCVIARASLMESQNWLIDAVDRRYISETDRVELNALAEIALQEVTGLMEYLQSPEALRNARRARERRAAGRHERLNARAANPENSNPEPSNPEPRTPNPERSNSEAPNPEPNLNTNREASTEKRER
jgi:four helix bundle protein